MYGISLYGFGGITMESNRSMEQAMEAALAEYKAGNLNTAAEQWRALAEDGFAPAQRLRSSA